AAMLRRPDEPSVRMGCPPCCVSLCEMEIRRRMQPTKRSRAWKATCGLSAAFARAARLRYEQCREEERGDDRCGSGIADGGGRGRGSVLRQSGHDRDAPGACAR